MAADEIVLARFVGFAALGVLTTTQELAGQILVSIPQADPQSVVEETFSLVAVTSARASEVGFATHASLGRIVSHTLASLPFSHQDYLVGGAVLSDESAQPAIDSDQLSRRIQFYSTHFPESAFPGPLALQDKMELWVGRVSVPGLDTSPAKRLEELQLVDALHLHLRLLLGFARQLVS
jgi:hypothetical protein